MGPPFSVGPVASSACSSDCGSLNAVSASCAMAYDGEGEREMGGQRQSKRKMKPKQEETKKEGKENEKRRRKEQRGEGGRQAGRQEVIYEDDGPGAQRDDANGLKGNEMVYS